MIIETNYFVVTDPRGPLHDRTMKVIKLYTLEPQSLPKILVMIGV